MNPLKELLVEELRDLLHAEGQLVAALPKMAEAAHDTKLKEAFLKHLKQTEEMCIRDSIKAPPETIERFYATADSP